MTREQEREQASVEYTKSTNPRAIGGDAFSDVTYIININHSFIEGSRWADKTMIDKACKWIEDHLVSFRLERVLKDFRKAMEE